MSGSKTPPMLLFIGFSFSTSTRSSNGISLFAMLIIGNLFYRLKAGLLGIGMKVHSRTFHAGPNSERRLTDVGDGPRATLARVLDQRGGGDYNHQDSSKPQLYNRAAPMIHLAESHW